MKFFLAIFVCFAACDDGCAVVNELQALVNKAESGSTLNIKSGVYKGNLTIEKSITIIAQGKVVIDGEFQGTVVNIKADNVYFQGFVIVNSGDNHTLSDSCLEVSGRNNTIDDNLIENCFFGIKVKDSIYSLFKNNKVSSYKDKDVSDRGDGFFVWNSHFNKFQGNQISYVRDFSINNSNHNYLSRNRINHSRTGFYLVFAKETNIENNSFEWNSTGIAALYSEGVKIKKNVVIHSLSGNSSCISLKESVGAIIQENQLIHCGVGYLSDAPKGEDTIHVVRNLFAQNFLAIRIYGQKGSHDFVENVFFENLDNLFLPLDGDYAHIKWERNFWDNYLGFGKEPYLDVTFADRIWMEIPMAKFFSNTPFFEIIDFLEKLAPFTSPTIQAEDKFPQNRNSVVFKRYKNVIYNKD